MSTFECPNSGAVLYFPYPSPVEEESGRRDGLPVDLFLLRDPDPARGPHLLQRAPEPRPTQVDPDEDGEQRVTTRTTTPPTGSP